MSSWPRAPPPRTPRGSASAASSPSPSAVRWRWPPPSTTASGLGAGETYRAGPRAIDAAAVAEQRRCAPAQHRAAEGARAGVAVARLHLGHLAQAIAVDVDDLHRRHSAVVHGAVAELAVPVVPPARD